MSNEFPVWSLLAVLLVAGCSTRGESEQPSSDHPRCRGEIVESEALCLQDTFCYPLRNGRWCTGPGAVSDCPGEVVDGPSDCLLDDAYCYEIARGKWCTGEAVPECPTGSEAIADETGCPKGFTCWQASESLTCGRPVEVAERP